MKQRVKCQRILILLLILFTVLAHVLYLPGKIAEYSFLTGRSRSVEDVHSIRHSRDYLELNAVHQEQGGDMREPVPTVYKDGDLATVANGTSGDVGLIKKTVGHVEEAGGRSGRAVDNAAGGRNRHASEWTSHRISVISGEQEQSTQTGEEDENSQAIMVAFDENLRHMKDQLIMAKAYLTFAPPTSNSHLVKELRLRIKEVERAVGDATKDSDLHRSAFQKMQSMETTLSKASRVYSNCSPLASKLRAMIANTEEQVSAQRSQVDFLTHLTTTTISKGLHCLSMRLTDDFFSLHPEEWEFPNVHKLQQSDLYHYAIFSDNSLACGVVINSTISSSKEPEKLVFHIVTDALNLPAMKMWFLANQPGEATIEVQSIDDFKVRLPKEANSRDPRFRSALNYLRFYLPALFPNLNKIVLLDHDVVVQRDLRGLWDVDMKGKVNGAVQTCGDYGYEMYRNMAAYVNFSNSVAEKKLNAKTCTWAFGMNVFDLQEWRRLNLTSVYLKWLELEKRRPLFKAGSLPLGLVTFYNLTVALDRRWHVLGLGTFESGLARFEIERAAVVHYNGRLKPWLDIAIPKYRGYWSKFVPYDHPYLQQCNIHM